MSIFTGAPKEEKKLESNTWNNLNNLFTHSFEGANALGQKGTEATGTATDYYSKVAKGDRTAIAPAANTAVQMADAKKREQAQMGTARGGGTAGGNQQIDDQTRALIASLMGDAQEGAAGQLASIGGNETNQMMSALGIASGTETNLSSLLHQDIQQKNASAAKMWGALIGGGLKLATGGVF